MTSHELYLTDPQAANDLWNDGYRMGVKHAHEVADHRAWLGGFCTALILALGVVAFWQFTGWLHS